MDNSTVISIEDVFRRFSIGGGEFTALKKVSLSFKKGEFAALVGPSGSGKTTLLNIIGSLDVPSEGSVRVLGKAIENLSPGESARMRARDLGFIFQTYNLLPVYTVFENVELPLLLLKVSASERRRMILEAIDAVGLSEKIDSRPDQLSGGECQRVAIARAMVKTPSIVLADEPTANLDTENSYNILRIMKKLNSDYGSTFLFASHDEKVIRYMNRIITLNDGRVVSDELQKGYPQ